MRIPDESKIAFALKEILQFSFLIKNKRILYPNLHN